jgi:hypothetical protein
VDIRVMVCNVISLMPSRISPDLEKCGLHHAMVRLKVAGNVAVHRKSGIMNSFKIIKILCTYAAVALFLAPLTIAEDSLSKAIKLYEAGKFADALPALQECVRAHPADGRLHYYLANALSQLGNYPEAVKQYNECIRCDPKSTAAKYSKLALLNYAGDHPAQEKPPDPSQPTKPNSHIQNYHPTKSIFLKKPVPIGLNATQDKLIFDDRSKSKRK